MSSKGRVLVTGATGCVGRLAVSALVERGWDVVAVRSRQAAEDTPGVAWLQANLLEPSEVRRVVADSRASHLLHLAWNIEPGRWVSAPENVSWVRASLDLLTAFRNGGGVRAVSAGSCLEYDWTHGYCVEDKTPLAAHTLYGTCKHALQLISTATGAGDGFTTAWGRIFFLYGPGEHPDRLVASVIRSILAGEPARTSHGRQIRDYLYAGDVADAFVRLLDSEVTGPINIASGRPVELRTIVLLIGELMGRPDLIQLGAIPQAATDTPLVVGDTARLTSRLGWTPAWALTRGLEASIDWWRARERQTGGVK